MQNRRAAVALGMLALLVIALGIGWMLLDPPKRHQPKTLPAAPDWTEPDDDPDDKAAPATTTQGGMTAVADNASGSSHSKVEAPIVAEAVSVRVSGVALDYFDDAAPGITLTLLPEAGDSISGPAAITDAQGAFLFEAQLTPGAGYFVACLQEGKALTATETFRVNGQEDVSDLVIRIYAAARVWGVVLNGADDSPLPDVNIRMDTRSDARLARLAAILGRCKPARSDEQGRFSVEGIAPGAYLVLAEKRGWTANELDPVARSRQEVELDEYSNVELLPFVLKQAGVIEGFVLHRSDRSPVVGAAVDLGTAFGGSFDATTTDDKGFYRFETVPPPVPGPGDGGPIGTITVRAVAPGLAIGSRNVRVQGGEKRENVNLLLEDGATVKGRVVTATGEGIGGASVYFNYNDFLRNAELVSGVNTPDRAISTTADAQGNFELSNLPVGQAEITARAKGYSHGTATATTAVDAVAEVTVVLAAEGWIEGVVTSAQGNPVSGVAVAAFETGAPGEVSFVMKSLFGEVLPDRGESPMFSSPVRSAEDGSYRIPALRAGRFIVVAATRSWQRHISDELDVRAGAGTVHNIALAAGATIFGRVYDSAGKPIVGAAITGASLFGQDSARIRTDYTDSSGNYELTGLSPGTYTVIRNDGNAAALFMPSARNQVKVESGQRVQYDILEQRPGTARLYGRVTADGEPYAEQPIVLIGGSRAGITTETTRTDAQGNYEFRGVPLGMYQVAQARGPFPSLVRRRVSVTRQGDVEFDVEFITVKITGKVALPGGGIAEGRVRVIASPVSPEAADRGNAEEQVNDLEMQVATEAVADPETGLYELTGLSPGFYRVTARSDNHGMVMRPYVNVRVAVTGLLLTLPGEGATLKGTVVGVDGIPNNTPFGLIAALTVEDERGQPVALGGFDNGVNLTETREFEVRNLAEGRFTVTLSLTGYTPATHANVVFKAGETVALAFQFAASGNLRISLLNDDIGIETALGLEYEIRDSRGELFKKRFTFLDFFQQDGTATQSADDNSFTIKDLPPGDYTISLTLPDYAPVKRDFTIIAGETATTTVEFRAE